MLIMNDGGTPRYTQDRDTCTNPLDHMLRASRLCCRSFKMMVMQLSTQQRKLMSSC